MAEQGKKARMESFSQHSQASHTAQEYIQAQLQLEADAREALPYQFDTCTKPLGPLRQTLFSCLTCNPPPSDPSAPYTAAGVCYSCSISCHGEHELVELFTRRNFVCDCGTSRLPSTSPCTLRINAATGAKGDVHSEEPSATNTYNQNFRNRFCACGQDYDPEKEKTTMFQCIGLGSAGHGGCGEDWWHPECLMGRLRSHSTVDPPEQQGTAKEEELANGDEALGEEADIPLPLGFPAEDDFEHVLCYKCTSANPWIKRYAGTPGFLPAVIIAGDPSLSTGTTFSRDPQEANRKRKAEDEQIASTAAEPPPKRSKAEDEETPIGVNLLDMPTGPIKPDESASKAPTPEPAQLASVPEETTDTMAACRHKLLPLAPSAPATMFLKEDFRDSLCRCPNCFPLLSAYPQLLEEEEAYEPPVSEGSSQAPGQNGYHSAGGSTGTKSLLDRGEAALSNMDRVRAIEGVMVYNNLRDKVKAFLKPFAESGQPVGAEDIKAYFEKLRGDDEAMKAAAAGAQNSGSGGGNDGDDNRREQKGF